MSSMTGVSYNEKEMVEHKSLWHPGHPERPERLQAVLQRCRELGLIQRCKFIEPRLAELEEISPPHTREHVESLGAACDLDLEVLSDSDNVKDLCLKYDASYIHPYTFKAARLACGAVIDLTQNILEGKIQNGMAIVRPPGHHAMKSEICGYCFFNNVAVGAAHALGSGLAKKVLIVDFDYHHGQGTQQLFYDDPRVLYFSTHGYLHGMDWPYLQESNSDWVGSGDGRGFNCNIPLNKKGMGNTEFLTIWHKILIPMAYQFNPDLVLISAGFDAALNDPMGGMKISPQCYPHLVAPLMGLADGKVCAVLEGGYCLRALSEGAALVLRTLLRDPCPLIPAIGDPMSEIVETIVTATVIQREFWSLLGSTYPQKEEELYDLPELRYDYDTPKPSTYSPIDVCPVESFEGKSQFDEELEELILNADLSVNPLRLEVVNHEENPAESKTTAGSGVVQRISEFFNKVVGGEIRCGLGILPPSLNVGDVLNAMDQKGRTLVLTLGQKINLPSQLSKESNILNISIYKKGNEREDSLGQSSKNNINIGLSGDLSDMVCFLAFTNLILPIAYEFGPNLIAISYEDELNVSVDCLSHLTHFLMPLANGKVVVLTNSDKIAKSQADALFGIPLPRLQLKNVEVDALAEMQHLQMELGKNWTVLKPFCKRLPDDFSVKHGKY